jgi:molybdenum cofactor cytidylyltransferase
MGRPKMLLPWGTTSVLGHLIRSWRKARSDQITIVCASGDSAIEVEMDRLNFPRENRIQNPDPARGMFSSLQCGACWTGWQPSLTHCAVALGDQPHLQSATLTFLIDFARQHPEKICQPAQGGRTRHPVILPVAAFKRLAVSNAGTFQQFLRSAPEQVASIELSDPGLDLDIDTPGDYQKALKLSAPT